MYTILNYPIKLSNQTTDECRGVGGIFFDDLDESDVSGLTREQLFQFASVSSYFSLLVVRIDYYYYYCY